MSVSPTIHLSVCLSVCLSIYLSVCLSICPSVYPSICPSVFIYYNIYWLLCIIHLFYNLLIFNIVLKYNYYYYYYYFIFFTLISPFLTICMPLCYVTLYNLYSYYFALSTERTWFDYISLLIIPCITIMWQIKKPWTLNLEPNVYNK